MKRSLTISCLVILILTTSVAGCTGLLDTKKTNTPEATLKTYIAAFNRGDSDTIYNLLSSQAKSQTRKDDIKSTMELASEFGVKFGKYEITSSDITGDKATVRVKTTVSIGGYDMPSTETMHFVKEGKDWKIQGIFMPH